METEQMSYKKSNFGGAFFFLPEDKKEALGAVYAFCRLADDIVDEGYADAQARLDNLRKEVELVFTGAPQSELGRALKDAVKKFPIPKHYFLDLIEGVNRDLHEPVRFETYGDLKWYMHRVASTVGLMCIEIFGYKDKQSKEYAVTLGYAVQLTNIVRDLVEDGKMNRIYIPKEDIEKFGLTQDDILHPVESVKLKALLLFELERAQNLYLLSDKLLPGKDFRNFLPARAMGNIYYGIFKKLQKNPCRFKGKKVKLSNFEKLRILFKTWRETP